MEAVMTIPMPAIMIVDAPATTMILAHMRALSSFNLPYLLLFVPVVGILPIVVKLMNHIMELNPSIPVLNGPILTLDIKLKLC